MTQPKAQSPLRSAGALQRKGPGTVLNRTEADKKRLLQNPSAAVRLGPANHTQGGGLPVVVDVPLPSHNLRWR